MLEFKNRCDFMKKENNNPNNKIKNILNNFLYFFFYFTDQDEEDNVLKRPIIKTEPKEIKIITKHIKKTVVEENKTSTKQIVKTKEVVEQIPPTIILIPKPKLKETKQIVQEKIKKPKVKQQVKDDKTIIKDEATTIIKPVKEEKEKEIKEQQDISFIYLNNLKDIIKEDIKLSIQIEDELHEINSELDKLKDKKNLKEEQNTLDKLYEKIKVLKEKCEALVDNHGLSIDIPDYNLIKLEKDNKTESVVNYLKFIEDLHGNINEELKYRQDLLKQKEHELEKIKIEKNYFEYINNLTNNIISNQNSNINKMQKDLGKIEDETITKTKLVMNMDRLLTPVLFLSALNNTKILPANPLNMLFVATCLGVSLKNIFNLFEWKEFKNTKFKFHDYTNEIRNNLYTIKDSMHKTKLSLLDIKNLKKQLTSKDYKDLKNNKAYKSMLEKLDTLELDLKNKTLELKVLEKELEAKKKINEKAKTKHKEMTRKR